MKYLKKDSHLIGRDDRKVNLIITPWNKMKWDFTYRKQDQTFLNVLYPMVIDLARIHPDTKFRTAVLGTSRHDRMTYRRTNLSHLYYPDYLEHEAILYFMTLWLMGKDYRCELEDHSLRFWS